MRNTKAHSQPDQGHKINLPLISNLWSWRRRLRVPWAARTSNQSILKEINLEYALEDWWGSWSSNTLATWCEESTHWKRPWCRERLRAGGGWSDRGRDGWMASLTHWAWVWANSGRWWRTGRPDMLQSMWSQRGGHDWATEQQKYQNWCWNVFLIFGRVWGQEEKGTTEDEMAGWHHWLDGREFQWTPGVGDGQGGLACCDSWGRQESDTTERLIWSEGIMQTCLFTSLIFNIVPEVLINAMRLWRNKKTKAGKDKIELHCVWITWLFT